MSNELFASVAGHRCKSFYLLAPNVGPWFCEAELDEQANLSGAVEVVFGSLTLRGTVAPSWSGTFVATSTVRVVAGGGGWGKTLAAKGYHNDGGVRAATVAEDAAREAGEKLGGFAPGGSGKIGNDYERAAGPASRALEDAAGGAPWWVDYNGVTQVGPRPAPTLKTGDYTVLSFDPNSRLVELAADDPAKVFVGGVITDRLESPGTIRELEFKMSGGKLRAVAWIGGDTSSEGRLVRLFEALVERILARRLFGKYRYRVVRMAVDGRVELQAVSKAAGLPDIVPAMMRPGIAGAWADLTLGCEVLVEFIAGAPTDPICTAFPGRNEGGFVPAKLTLGATSPGSAPPAARQADAVKVLLPPGVFTGTITIGGTPSPASGVVSWVNPYALGTITGGSGKVGIGT